MMMRPATTSHGFALPTILITSVVMLIVLISAVSAASSVRAALDNQYYTQLAREAAESGMALAIGCMKANNYVPQWSWLNTNSTSCAGGNSSCSSGPNCYLYQKGSTFSRFYVDSPSSDGGSSYVLRSEGTVTIQRTGGAEYRYFETDVQARIGADGTLSPILYGQ